MEVVLSRLRAEYPEDYVLYNIPTVALACVLPHASALMDGWHPLEAPTQGAAVFRRWRRLLQGPPRGPLSAEDDPMAQLVAEVVVPPLRTAVVNEWDPRDPGALEMFLEVRLRTVDTSYTSMHTCRHGTTCSLRSARRTSCTTSSCPGCAPRLPSGTRRQTRWPCTCGCTRGCHTSSQTWGSCGPPFATSLPRPLSSGSRGTARRWPSCRRGTACLTPRTGTRSWVEASCRGWRSPCSSW